MSIPRIAFAFTLALGCVSAQTPTATLQGTVSDSSRAVVPQAKMVIINIDTNVAKELLTDSTGHYVQPSLLPGRYTVVAEKVGFRSVRQESVKLDVGQIRDVNFTLEVGGIADTVTVEAAPPALDTATATIGQVIEHKRILDLPLNGRSAFSLANLTPGVNPTGGGSLPAWVEDAGRRASSLSMASPLS